MGSEMCIRDRARVSSAGATGARSALGSVTHVAEKLPRSRLGLRQVRGKHGSARGFAQEVAPGEPGERRAQRHFPLPALSLAVTLRLVDGRVARWLRFVERAGRGFRSLGAVRTPLDVATRGLHATMRLGRYACSAPCDRATGGFLLAGPPKTISSVRFDTGSDLGSSRGGAERRARSHAASHVRCRPSTRGHHESGMGLSLIHI